MSENSTPENVQDVSEKQNQETQEPLTKKQKFWKEAKSIAIIVFCVFLFRSSFFEPFKIPSGSMIPTMMIGDFILVNKFAYGLKVPFTEWFMDPVYISKAKEPKRGDVIVFKYPNDPSLNYIKRVVGLPGDTVEIKNKILYINDRPVDQAEFDGKKIMDDMDDKFKNYNLKFYHVQTGDHKHVIQLNDDNFYNAYFSKRVIPAGKFFVMGDNRDFSADSRFWGYVPFENIKGKALFVWFSLILPFGDDNFKFRPWRIGTAIH